MQPDEKRNGLRQHVRLLGRTLIKDMQGYALKAKMTQRNCHQCVIALLFQSYLIKAQKQSPNINSANFFHDLLSCSNSAPANKELHTELNNTLALDLKMSKTLFFGGSKCGQFIHTCHVWHTTISVFLVCFSSSHRQSNLTFTS